MESLINRYRNVTLLLLAIVGQIVLLAWQVRTDADVPLVRAWAVTAVTPVAGAIESVRGFSGGFLGGYLQGRRAAEQAQKNQSELERLRLENQLLRHELETAQRAGELAGFQQSSPSRMIGARVIGATPGANSRTLLIDRGTSSGVRRGMAVVVPDGIVGRVLAAFPFASQVLTITDPGFAAGVESQKNHVHGVMKGYGNGTARVDYVATGLKVEPGEQFFTSGEDRVFPKGLPVGKVTGVHDSARFQEISLEPASAQNSAEDVFVILDPVHQTIPDAPAPEAAVFLGPDVSPNAAPAADPTGAGAPSAAQEPITSAGRLMDQYRKIGDAQKHVFGEGLPGSLPPNFNLKVPGVNAPADAQAAQPAPPKTAAPKTAAPQPAMPQPAALANPNKP